MKIINFYGGPHTGKTSMAYRTCSIMKELDLMVSPTLEYATKLIHENREYLLKENQTFISTNQHNMLRDLQRQDIFDYVVTDFPILMHQIYYNHGREPVDFETFCTMTHQLHFDKGFENIEVFCMRDYAKPYETKGRIHTFEEAEAIDDKIMSLFHEYEIPYHVYDPKSIHPDDFIKNIITNDNPPRPIFQ